MVPSWAVSELFLPVGIVSPRQFVFLGRPSPNDCSIEDRKTQASLLQVRPTLKGHYTSRPPCRIGNCTRKFLVHDVFPRNLTQAQGALKGAQKPNSGKAEFLRFRNQRNHSRAGPRGVIVLEVEVSKGEITDLHWSNLAHTSWITQSTCTLPWDRSTLRRSFQKQGHSKDIMNKSNMCL